MSDVIYRQIFAHNLQKNYSEKNTFHSINYKHLIQNQFFSSSMSNDTVNLQKLNLDLIEDHRLHKNLNSV